MNIFEATTNLMATITISALFAGAAIGLLIGLIMGLTDERS